MDSKHGIKLSIKHMYHLKMQKNTDSQVNNFYLMTANICADQSGVLLSDVIHLAIK